MRPTYYRFMVDWAKNVDAEGKFDPVAPQGGCLRTLPPCAGWFGIRAQLEAIAVAQKAAPGRFRVLADVYDTPAMLARPPSGCETSDAEPRSRPPRDLEDYKAMLRAVHAEAERAGVEIELWAPWNEPNHAYFISPQRSRCDPGAESVSVRRYVELARAAQEVVGADRVVPAELAGVSRERRSPPASPSSSAPCPRDLVCGAPVFTQHDYDGGPDPLPLLKRELDRLRLREPAGDLDHGGRRPPGPVHPRARCARWTPPISAAGTATRASPPPSTTRCARTTCTRRASSAPTSRGPSRPLELWQAWGSGNTHQAAAC